MLLLHRLFHADGVPHQRQVGQDSRSRRSFRLPLCSILTNLAAFAALGLATASPGVESALGEGEIITAISFPIPQKAIYLKFRQPASRFALVGVFVARTAQGVRVAITGASSDGVFRHKGLEDALNRSFTPEAVAGVKIDASGLNSDLHASAEYRAHLIGVQTQRAVKQLAG